MPSDLNPVQSLIDFLSNQDQDKSTQEIGEALGMNRNLVSKYLSILHMQGRVELRTYGTLKMYRLSKRVPFQAISDIVSGVCLGLDRLLIIKDVGNDPEPFFSECRASLPGKRCVEINHPCFEDVSFLDQLKLLVEGKQSERITREYWKNQYFHIVTTYLTVFNDGTPGVAITITDETAGRRLHHEIDQVRHQYLLQATSSQEMILHLSPDKTILFVNASYTRYNHADPDVLIGTVYEPVLPSDDIVRLRKAFASLSQLNPDVQVEHRVVLQDGSIRWQQWTITAFFLQKQVSAYYLSGTDITRLKLMESQLHQYESGLENILKEKTDELREVTRNLYKEIEDRKRLERELSQKEELFRNLTESTSDIIWEVDANGSFTYVNPVFCTTLGYGSEEIIGRTPLEFLPPDSGELLLKTLHASIQNNEAFSQVDLPFVRRDGTQVIIELSGVISKDSSGKLSRVRGIGRDITARKKGEDEKRKLLTIIEQSPDFIGICDIQGRIQYINPAGLRLLEIPDKTDILSLSITRFQHERSRLKIKNGVSAALKGGYWRGETSLLSWNDKEIPVTQIISSHQASQEEPPLLFTIAQDISEYIYHDRELSRLNAYNRNLLEASLDPLVTIGYDGTIQSVNTATEQALGLSRDDLIGTDFNLYFTDPERAEEGFLKAFSDGFIRDYRLEMKHRDGHTIPVLYNASVYRDDSGKIQGVFAAARDMSSLYQVEYELRQSLDYYLQILDNFPNPIWRTNTEKRYDYFNTAWLTFTGRSIDEELGDGWIQGVYPEDLSYWETVFSSSFETRKPFFIQYRLRYHDGTYRWVINYGSPLYSRNGEFMGYLGSCYDIDQIKRAQEIVVASEKKYRQLHESMMDGYAAVDMYGTILDFNESFRSMLGYETEELRSLSYSDITDEGWTAAESDIIQNQVLTRGYSDVYEKEYCRKDGTTVPVEIRTVLSRDDNGHPASMWAIIRDITNRKKIERTLIENKNILISNQIQLISQNEELTRNYELISQLEAKYRLISEHSTDVIWLLDIGTMGFTYISPSVERLRGYTPEEVISAPFDHSLTSEFADQVRRELPVRIRAFESGEESARVSINELELLCKDGSYVQAEIVTTLLTNTDGKVTRILGVTRDISARKAAELQVAQSQEFYRILFETSLYGVIFVDEQGQIISANPASEQILGISASQMLGRYSGDPMWKTIHEDGSPFPAETHPALLALKTGRVVRNVVMGVFNQTLHQYVWIKITSIPLFHHGDDRPYIVNTIFEDISLQINLERSKQNWQNQAVLLTQILENSNQPFGIAHPDGTLWYANSALSSLLQYSTHDLVSGAVPPLLTHKDWEETGNWREDRGYGPCRIVKKWGRKDGTFVDVEVYLQLVSDETGDPEYYYLLVNESRTL